ncbi:MAG: polysaccharide biosynthesis/export family protein [Methyloceanibacter sp.]
MRWLLQALAAAWRVDPRYAPPGVPVNPSEPYRLDSGDRVRVIVFGQDNPRLYSVNASGYMAMTLVGSVLARNLTTRQLTSEIARRLREKYVKEPKVSVEVETWARSENPDSFPTLTP